MDYRTTGTAAMFTVDSGESSSSSLWDHSDPAFGAIPFDAYGFPDLNCRTSVGAAAANSNVIPGTSSLPIERSPAREGKTSGCDAGPSTNMVLANLVRQWQYAAGQPAAQTRRSHLPIWSCDGAFGPLAWDSSFDKPCPEIGHHPTQLSSSCSSSPTLEELLELEPLSTSSLDIAPLDPQTAALTPNWTGLPTSCDHLAAVPTADFNTTFDAADYSVSLLAEPHHASSPASTATPDCKTRASPALSDATVPTAPRPRITVRPRKPKATSKNSGFLNIIQYQPEGDDGRLTKKRAAHDEIAVEEDAPQTIRQIDLVSGSGEVNGMMVTFGKRVKKRNAFTQEKRQQTALVRREGVCMRCKKSKRQCDLALQVSPYISCTLCASTRIYKNVPRMPCFRSRLVDILFFRAGPAANEPLFTKRDTVYHLGDPSKPDVPVRTLKLTQRIGPQQLTVYASEFVPKPEDVTSYKWKDRQSGELREIPMPHFCLTNISKVQNHYLEYIKDAKWAYLNSLRQEDDLSRKTVDMAMAYARKRPESLVANALDLWAVSRMIEIPWEMCGEDTLGVERIVNTANPHHGRIPIPPIMDTQLDQIVIKNILTPIRQRVIDKFQLLIAPAKPEAWFEIYLAAFVMLNHIERLARHSVFHASLHSMPTKYSNTKFLEEAFHTAKVILSRFHFVCNGAVPLKCDWKTTKTIEMARLDHDEVEFMKDTQVMIRERENTVLSLRAKREYEHPLYWSHQLFFENWDSSADNTID